MKINCHCHIFSLDCVPREFRDRFVLNVDNPIHRLSHWLVRRIIPPDCKLNDWLRFIDLPISDIAWKLVGEMDEAGIELCTPLMMDMEYCREFGGGTKRFEEQINETVEAVEAINAHYGRPRMLPFIAADPNRPDMQSIVRDALSGGVFKGVKIYPVMGYTPDDQRLYPLYEHCAENNIPITTHCENGGIPGLDAYYHLADPKYWTNVLRDIDTLTLNLAHNDRTGSPWQRTIAELIATYPNVYTDVSYDVEMFFIPGRYFKSVRRLLRSPETRDKVLYGTDWYMGRCFWTEASYLKWFREYSKRIWWCAVAFSDEDIKRLTEDNPRRFLRLSEEGGNA